MKKSGGIILVLIFTMLIISSLAFINAIYSNPFAYSFNSTDITSSYTYNLGKTVNISSIELKWSDNYKECYALITAADFSSVWKEVGSGDILTLKNLGVSDYVKIEIKGCAATRVYYLNVKGFSESTSSACSKDSDCPATTNLVWCCNPSYLCTNTTSYKCLNPGTSDSSCVPSMSSTFTSFCSSAKPNCVDGACINNTAFTPSCTDSDGGLNYSTKGNNSGISEEGKFYFNMDYCPSVGDPNYGILQEYGCTSAGISSVTGHTCPNGCSYGACVGTPTEPTPVATCNDSDGGQNYSVKGILNYTNEEGESFTSYDVCVNSSVVVEGFCGPNTEMHTCPNGCVNGACVKGYQILLETASDTSATIKVFDESGNAETKDILEGTSKLIDGIEIGLNNAEETTTGISADITLKNLELSSLRAARVDVGFDYKGYKFYLVSATDTSATIKVVNPSLEESTVEITEGSSKIIKGLEISVQKADETKLEVSASISIRVKLSTSFSQVCQSLIDILKDPKDTSERILSWNNTYTGADWVNDKKEAYKEYSAAWYWNSQQYDENQINYYYVSYDIQVFDNKNIDLSEYASWNNEDPACKANSYWVNNKENFYYICNWDVLYGQQDLNNNYKSNNRQIFWYNGNVVVRLYIYYGDSLTDAEIAKLSQQKLNDLINNLQDNQYKYIDWSNFDIGWPAASELYDTIQKCGSDIEFNWSSDYLSWDCKIEPVICPSHGEQKKICRAWDNSAKKYITRESSFSCSPGICSGCYTPKWFESTNNKCIPYGFRFAQDSGADWKIVDSEEQGYLNEQNGDLVLTVDSDTEATLTFVTKAGNYTYTLIEGSSVDITEGINALGDDDGIVSLILEVNDVVQSTSGNYVDTKIKYKQYRQEINKINAYCDIDGFIKQQKTKDYNGNWAACQNNYECESNICSYGECIEVKDMFAEVSAFKSTFVKVICKLSHLFSIDNYNNCIYEYLGDEGVKKN